VIRQAAGPLLGLYGLGSAIAGVWYGTRRWRASHASRLTAALTVTVPEVRARAMDEFARTISVVSDALAKRAGRPADDLAVRTVAGAIIGVIMSITMPWDGWSDPQTIEDTFQRIDRALGLLEAGLPL